jgi:hypothetical protein
VRSRRDEARRDFEIIVRHGDAARTTLLGGVDGFRWREVWAAAHRLDVTRWHRLRLVAASLIPNLRQRIA